MRFIAKLIIIISALALVYLLPHKTADAIHGIILAAVLLAVLFVILPALVELKLLRLPAIRRGKTERTPGGKKYRTVTYNGLDVYYTMKLNGGGLGLSHEFVRLVSKHIGKVEHIYEFCAGPGFIGFNLLANGLCDRLTLSDINPEALEALRETVRQNGLEDRVTLYHSDGLNAIPESEKWDLVVSNPPWHTAPGKGKNLVLFDKDAGIHKSFFEQAPRFLNPGGSVLFVESHEYTSRSEMLRLLDGSAMELVQYFPPTPLLQIPLYLKEYSKISKPLALTLRFALFFLEIYFIQFKPSSRAAKVGP